MASLRDLAHEANVSIRTVARVLHNKGYVSLETRQRVLQAARDLGYAPNYAARALRTGRSYEVSVFVGSLDELHVAKLAAFEQAMRAGGYAVQVSFAAAASTQLSNLLALVQQRRPAALLFLPSSLHQFTAQTANALQGLEIPVLLIDGAVESLPAIHIARSAGVEEAVKYLLSQGHKNLAYVGPETDASRLPAYRRAMKAAELPVQHLALRRELGEYESGQEAVKRVLALSPRPTAVQIYSDVVATGFLAGLHQAGIRVPEQMAVVGFDDRACAALSWPRLTTVAQPNAEVGKTAAEWLLEQIGQQVAASPSAWQCEIPTRLVVREST